MIARPFAVRLAASVAAAAAIVLSTAGCTFLAPQATLIHYDAADGIGVDLGQLAIRNVIAVADSDQSVQAVNLVFSAINTSGKAITLNYSAPNSTGRQTDALAFQPGITSIPSGDKQIVVTMPKDAALGGLYPVTFTAEGADSVTVQVPILDAAGRDYLKQFVPKSAS